MDRTLWEHKPPSPAFTENKSEKLHICISLKFFIITSFTFLHKPADMNQNVILSPVDGTVGSNSFCVRLILAVFPSFFQSLHDITFVFGSRSFQMYFPFNFGDGSESLCTLISIFIFITTYIFYVISGQNQIYKVTEQVVIIS